MHGYEIHMHRSQQATCSLIFKSYHNDPVIQHVCFVCIKKKQFSKSSAFLIKIIRTTLWSADFVVSGNIVTKSRKALLAPRGNNSITFCWSFMAWQGRRPLSRPYEYLMLSLQNTCFRDQKQGNWLNIQFLIKYRSSSVDGNPWTPSIKQNWSIQG